MNNRIKPFKNTFLSVLLVLILPVSINVHSADSMDKSVTYNSQAEKSFVLKAAELDTKGMFNEAIQAYSKAIKLNQEGSPAYGGRGLVYAKMGNYSQAISDFNKAIAISPTDFEAHYSRALSYLYTKDYERALLGFHQVLTLNPGWADAHYDIGLIYQTQGKTRDALSSYSKAIKTSPGYAVKFYISRAAIYNELGEPDKAIADLNKAAVISPENYTIYYNRAISYFYKKEYSKSWSDLHKVDELGAKVPPILRQELEKVSGSKG